MTMLLPPHEALRMYEPAIADAAAGCHKLQLGGLAEADATRAGLVPAALASAATGSQGGVFPEPAGRSAQQQWRHTREPRLLDRGRECRSVKLRGCDERLQPSLGSNMSRQQSAITSLEWEGRKPPCGSAGGSDHTSVARFALYRPVFNLTVTHQQTDLDSREHRSYKSRVLAPQSHLTPACCTTPSINSSAPSAGGLGAGARHPRPVQGRTEAASPPQADRQRQACLSVCLPVCQTTPRVAN